MLEGSGAPGGLEPLPRGVAAPARKGPVVSLLTFSRASQSWLHPFRGFRVLGGDLFQPGLGFRVFNVFRGIFKLSDTVPDTDPELLQRAQEGDEAAFGIIMRTHHERTFRLAYAIVHNEADARDVAQEVWMTVWKQLRTFRRDSRFTTWLHPIVTRKSLDLLRKRRRWFNRFLPFDTGDDNIVEVPEPATTDDARSINEGNETVARVRSAIASLPPKQRVVLALRELEGLSYEEIAAATGVPAGTVMSRLFHARKLLAAKLGKDVTTNEH